MCGQGRYATLNESQVSILSVPVENATFQPKTECVREGRRSFFLEKEIVGFWSWWIWGCMIIGGYVDPSLEKVWIQNLNMGVISCTGG